MPSKETYWKDPEKYRAATLAYGKGHTDWKREANRAWTAEKRRNNPEWAKAESLKTRLRMTPEQKAERAEYQRRWFAENPDYSRMKQIESHRRAPARRMANSAKVRAKTLGVPFDLNWRDLAVPDICPVLGIKMEIGTGKLTPASPSIDRLVPVLGYVHSNVRIISQGANAIKKDKTLKEMEDYVSDLQRQLENAMAVVRYMSRELG